MNNVLNFDGYNGIVFIWSLKESQRIVSAAIAT
jgi:hypothetical protein